MLKRTISAIIIAAFLLTQCGTGWALRAKATGETGKDGAPSASAQAIGTTLATAAAAAGEGLVKLLQKHMLEYLMSSKLPTGEKIVIYPDGSIQFGSKNIPIKVEGEERHLLQPVLDVMTAANLSRLSISPAVVHEPLCHAFLGDALKNLSKVELSNFTFFLCGNVVLRMDSATAGQVEGVSISPAPAACANLLSAINERRPGVQPYELKIIEEAQQPFMEYQQTPAAFNAALELYSYAFPKLNYPTPARVRADVIKIIQESGVDTKAIAASKRVLVIDAISVRGKETQAYLVDAERFGFKTVDLITAELTQEQAIEKGKDYDLVVWRDVLGQFVLLGQNLNLTLPAESIKDGRLKTEIDINTWL